MKKYIQIKLNPADIWCENDVVLTSMRRDHVASTLIQRHFGTKCPLGRVIIIAFGFLDPYNVIPLYQRLEFRNYKFVFQSAHINREKI